MQRGSIVNALRSLFAVAFQKIFRLDGYRLPVLIGNDNAFAKFCFALEKFSLRVLNIFAYTLK